MSYDVALRPGSISCGCPHEGCCAGEDVDVGSPTYNLGAMFKEALGGRRLKELDGMECENALPLLLEAVVEMRADPARFKEFNPPNGWGDYEGALRFLEDFSVLCRRYPHFVVQIT